MTNSRYVIEGAIARDRVSHREIARFEPSGTVTNGGLVVGHIEADGTILDRLHGVKLGKVDRNGRVTDRSGQVVCMVEQPFYKYGALALIFG